MNLVSGHLLNYDWSHPSGQACSFKISKSEWIQSEGNAIIWIALFKQACRLIEVDTEGKFCDKKKKPIASQTGHHGTIHGNHGSGRVHSSRIETVLDTQTGNFTKFCGFIRKETMASGMKI
jgi:hypothetical protein